METVIDLDKVRKQYGTNVAVNDISMKVGKGEIFGIVGPNGAGKTTLIEIIEGLRYADSGTATILGKDIRKHAEEIKHRIGVLLQSTSIPGKAKVKEILSLYASFYNKTSTNTDVTRRLGLENKQNAYFKSLSGGWKQRVSLALALINDPAIVFLDEPSMGLDPNARNEMWKMIKQMRDEGRTIVVTTHYMEEAEVLCDRVAIINKGQLIALDTPKNLITLLGGTKRIGFKNVGQPNKEAIATLPFVTKVDWSPAYIELDTSNIDQTLKYVFQLAASENWDVTELKLHESTMNEVFSEMTSEGQGIA